MISGAREGRLPDRAVAITFDDGYWDNLHNAGPLLEAARTPAMFFATTAHTDSTSEFYWDALDRIFLQPGRLPELLRLQTVPYELDLGSAAFYGDEDFAAHRQWNVTQPLNPTPRQRAYRELCGVIHAQRQAVREQILAEIRDWAGVSAEGRESHRMMTSAEIASIERSQFLDVGAHTANHPVLSIEPTDSQRQEIRAHPAMSAEHRTWCFCYPFGGRRDYTAETVQLVKEAGYIGACSNFHGLVHRDTDPFQLPRFLVRDWNGEEFARRLESFFAWKPQKPPSGSPS
jgi:peptidoglycan/xylan/chitin deacetylase (PgdA/CDA1 family)